MADLLALSTRMIDSGDYEKTNRVTNELSEIGDGLAVVESFSHSVLLETGDGLVAFDASGAATGPLVIEAMRGWTGRPVRALVYTHGHGDHVGGSPAFAADAERSGVPRPTVYGHENVAVRMDRYDLTNGYNLGINRRQFGGVNPRHGYGIGDPLVDAGAIRNPDRDRFIPKDTLRPDVEFSEQLQVRVGDRVLELIHGKGETDDHLWAWEPQQRLAFVGDFLIWNFPNAGNPQKVQRYPVEWARTLRTIAARGPEMLLPAHGLPIEGRARIAAVLDDVATALEGLVADTLERMNAGQRLDTIVHEVRVPQHLLDRPYLRPFYDEPEFVVRNIWRLYGGWWDGDPAHVKPAPADQLAGELAALAGGAERLRARAEELASAAKVADDLRLACHLIELASQAAPDDRVVHQTRRDIFEQRRRLEMSLMSKGIYRAAAADSERKLG